MDLLVGDLEGDFNGDVVGLSVVGESVGFLVGEAVFVWDKNDNIQW